MNQKTLTKYAVQTDGLGKRYRSFWALKDCTITVPRGAVTALVGPNGAGKTTLLKLLVSLSNPTAGSSTVLGQIPKQSASYLSEIGYLAQEIPLYSQLTAEKHIAMGAHLNTRWDSDLAKKRLDELSIPLNKPISKLSGGQRAQVGLALALAKKPKLLFLDEPVAALDPLARVDFLSSLAQAVTDADGELTVIMSSHLLADLERICDHVIILASGQTQLCEDIDVVLATHKLLTGLQTQTTKNQAYTVIQESHTPRETTMLVRLHDPTFHDAHWHIRDVDIEEIVLAYMGQHRGDTK
ncbi:MAG TPA: ABC transporter ATP-binding protein [Patescibacteria group bacterium]|nr:ABC transporter ATP-binding protein [Patescibacteria group bacterium]